MEAPPRYRKNIEHVIYLKELHQRVRERLNQLPPSRMNMVNSLFAVMVATLGVATFFLFTSAIEKSRELHLATIGTTFLKR